MKKTVIVFLLILCTSIFILYGFISKDNKKGSNKTGNNNKKTEKDIAVTSKSSKQKARNNKNKKADKVLIVYFSLTGNTKKVANIMKDTAKGDIFEIQPDFDYSKVTSRTEMEELGQKQVDEGFQPELKNSVKNIEEYDLIIIGSPVWWYSVTPPVMSFLSQYDLKDKKVAPFCTCGSVAGEFFTQFEEAIPDAKVQKGLTLTEAELNDEEGLNEKIDTWLDELKN